MQMPGPKKSNKEKVQEPVDKHILKPFLESSKTNLKDKTDSDSRTDSY
jgi:hypothetical protein